MSYPIQDIFLKYYDTAIAQYPVDGFIHKTASDIMKCKTPALGGNVSICQDCGHLEVHYNSCRNRHCPCCQGLVKEKWIDKRKSEVIDAPYFHVVFTVPEELNPLIYANKKLLYSLLYKVSADTLIELAQDKKYLNASIGFMSILHTWGQRLNFHPHIHCVVLGGGLTKDLKFKTVKDNFLFPIYVVSKLFRGKFMNALKKLYKADKLVFSGTSLKFRCSNEFQRLVDLLYKKEWIPHIKETFKGAKNVIEYLGRYTHRIAISNSRIVSIRDTGITFSVKDYKKQGAKSYVTLAPVEFIRRFLMHILPKGFVKIRYYGIFSNRTKKVKLAICRNIIKGNYSKPLLEGLTAAQIIFLLFGMDVYKCPKCSSRNLKTIRLISRLE
ncbi:IS91 family transposase [Tepidanaerobacter acetatoxydans]|uniref:IS91 family transposase n=1 Tax=Tepidanaerobacter acetatoxydans TaxID=499229 RepID=UPI001BD35DA6|nr:IS91 family transposase [Tepidanaerobacter acetatoxydans]